MYRGQYSARSRRSQPSAAPGGRLSETGSQARYRGALSSVTQPLSAASAKAVRFKGYEKPLGSCTSDGVLSFSWRIGMAPPPVINYLVAHEAAHLIEMNHGPKFWKLCQELCPDTERCKAWLKRQWQRITGNRLYMKSSILTAVRRYCGITTASMICLKAPISSSALAVTIRVSPNGRATSIWKGLRPG